jgi:hypothetical protein
VIAGIVDAGAVKSAKGENDSQIPGCLAAVD